MYKRRQFKIESKNSFNLFSFYIFIYFENKSNKVKCHTMFEYST